MIVSVCDDLRIALRERFEFTQILHIEICAAKAKHSIRHWQWSRRLENADIWWRYFMCFIWAIFCTKHFRWYFRFFCGFYFVLCISLWLFGIWQFRMYVFSNFRTVLSIWDHAEWIYSSGNTPLGCWYSNKIDTRKMFNWRRTENNTVSSNDS